MNATNDMNDAELIVELRNHGIDQGTGGKLTNRAAYRLAELESELAEERRLKEALSRSTLLARIDELMTVINDPKTIAAEIASERQRQISVEGYTHEHDDEHTDGSLGLAACCYIDPEPLGVHGDGSVRHPTWMMPFRWPWEPEAWKPKGRRPDLIRAGALIVAEIERLDRLPKDTT